MHGQHLRRRGHQRRVLVVPVQHARRRLARHSQHLPAGGGLLLARRQRDGRRMRRWKLLSGSRRDVVRAVRRRHLFRGSLNSMLALSGAHRRVGSKKRAGDVRADGRLLHRRWKRNGDGLQPGNVLSGRQHQRQHGLCCRLVLRHAGDASRLRGWHLLPCRQHQRQHGMCCRQLLRDAGDAGCVYVGQLLS